MIIISMIISTMLAFGISVVCLLYLVYLVI